MNNEQIKQAENDFIAAMEQYKQTGNERDLYISDDKLRNLLYVKHEYIEYITPIKLYEHLTGKSFF